MRWRRGISAVYYAVFHSLCELVALELAPTGSQAAIGRIYRWLNHGELKKSFTGIAAGQPTYALVDILDNTISEEMRLLATNFIKLQSVRHEADYARDYEPTWEETVTIFAMATNALAAIRRISKSGNAHSFVLALLLSKQPERRP